MKSIRVSIDFLIEYDDEDPDAFTRARELMEELLSMEIEGDAVRIVQTRSYS
jgi:hypothetical protein